jgi:dihydropteroate synthase
MSLPSLLGPDASPFPLPESLASLERALVMGVVNVTPDSFSDGGQWLEPAAAVTHGTDLVALGADIVDVGGESTRPGAPRVPVEEELRRVLPVVSALAAGGAVVSIDTMRAQVAELAVAAGAAIVNDVSGGLADPGMASFVASAAVPYVLGHWRGHSDVMDDRADYDDVLRDVIRELRARVEAFEAAGVDPAQIVLDPGLGFAKPGVANWPILAGLDELLALGHPVLLGASRKRFLGHLLAGADPSAQPVPPTERDRAGAAVSALAALAGVWAVRVHEVPPSRDAVLVAAAWRGARRGLTVARAGSYRNPRAAASPEDHPAVPDAGNAAPEAPATDGGEVR